jgi:hypothetical protein
MIPPRLKLIGAVLLFALAVFESIGQVTNVSLRVFTTNGMFNQMEMYHAVMNRWYRLEPLPVAVHGVTGAAFVNGFIHAPGGGTSTGGSSGSLIHQVFWVGDICP